MSIFTQTLWGVRIWIWLYFIFSIIAGLFVVVLFYKELIKKSYYKIRFPEKIINVTIHYKSGMYKEYWRIMPDNNKIECEGKQYNYDNNSVINPADIFAKNNKNNTIITINNKQYNYLEYFNIKNRWKKYPEIHYFFNNPSPISFDLSKKAIDLSSKQLEDFKKNDLFDKLLTLTGEKNILTMLLIIIIVNLLATLTLLSKIMGWIK